MRHAHKQGQRPDLGDHHFRSSWEANYARYLNQMMREGKVARWEYEPVTFWFHTIKRGVRSYMPDFKVWPSRHYEKYLIWKSLIRSSQEIEPHFVEVKGYMDARSKTKIKRMAKYYPEVDLRVFGAAQYKVLCARYSHLPGWEFPGGRSNPLAHPEDRESDLGVKK